MSSVVELSLNPPLNAAFDLVPPGSSSSVGSAALHPDAIIDAIDPGGSSAGVWEDHELASDFPDDATAGHRRWAPSTDGSPRW